MLDTVIQNHAFGHARLPSLECVPILVVIAPGSGRGVALANFERPELGVQMAGKTGTAQVRRITKAERQAGGKQAEDTPWKYRDHALFVSFAPVDEPRYAVAVVIEHGRSGTYAAKVTKDVMTEVLRRDPLKQPAVGSLGGSSRPIREG